MSANLAVTKTGEAMMAYVAKEGKPWHGRGVAVDELMTTHQALITSGCDFEVEKVPAYAQLPSGELVKDDRHAYTVRADTNAILGLVGSRYPVIQTRDAARFFDAALGKDVRCIDTVGALGNGARIWLASTVDETKGELLVLPNGEEIRRHIMLLIGHDGYCGINAYFTAIRPVCQNTVSAAIKEGEAILKVRHTANAKENLERAFALLDASNIYWARLREAFSYMTTIEVTPEMLTAFLEEFLPNPKEDDGEKAAEVSSRLKNRRESIVDAFDNSPGADLAGHTAWGLYNAVTYQIDHGHNESKSLRAGKGDDSWEVSMFGSGARMRQKAMDLLLAL